MHDDALISCGARVQSIHHIMLFVHFISCRPLLVSVIVKESKRPVVRVLEFGCVRMQYRVRQCE
jgi:hypothetical protein